MHSSDAAVPLERWLDPATRKTSQDFALVLDRYSGEIERIARKRWRHDPRNRARENAVTFADFHQQILLHVLSEYLRGAPQLAQVRDHASFRIGILKLADNAAHPRPSWAREERRRAQATRLSEVMAEGAGVVTRVDQRLLFEACEAILRSMPGNLAEAVRLSYSEGLKSAEIAARVGISEAAARKRLQRGLSALREALGVVLDSDSLRDVAQG